MIFCTNTDVSVVVTFCLAQWLLNDGPKVSIYPVKYSSARYDQADVMKFTLNIS